ncbi:MAG: nucleotidyltransferase domain-containing protein [Oscillospiraceae bacterium]|nr:nucleotidyltransferase domain-containing protein [Oscillospiraceae bacterium]
MEYKDILKAKEYAFLNENTKLDNILFLTLSGSISYGTNLSMSDIDLRGVLVEPKESILGFGNFEQYEDENTDTVIYGLKKFIKLCLNCNPNALELLGTKDEHVVYMNSFGEKIRDNYENFLSKRAFDSFGNYALAQLSRLENGIKNKKDELHLNKHAMHLIRLLIMGKEILMGLPINTYREKDRDFLLDIRNGKYSYEEIFKKVEVLENEFKIAYDNTKLPDEPDYKKAEDMVIEIYESSFFNR